MLKNIFDNIKRLDFLDNERTKSIVKNIFYSFFVKGGSVLVSFILVPIVLGLISTFQYGVWLTLSSVILWLNIFDAGIANGLRNKLTESLALKEYDKARKLISTTYVILIILAILLFIGLSFINQFINWYELINISFTDEKNLYLIIAIIIAGFSLQLIVQTINVILAASHKIALTGLISLIGQALILIVILIFKERIAGDLSIITVIFIFTPILVMFFSSVYLFNTEYKLISPSFKHFRIEYVREIFGIGGTFFLIQIGAIILFQTDNIIIIKILGANDVTNYNIAFKLFSIVTTIFTIIMSPYWNAFTDSYIKNDLNWIKNHLKLIRKAYFFLVVLTIIIVITSEYIIKLWINNKTIVNIDVIIAMAIYVIVYMWQTIYVFFLNGIGKIKLQMILVSISAIINIPLSIFLGRKFGLSGVISANTIVFVFMSILFHIQTKMILEQRALKIFNK